MTGFEVSGRNVRKLKKRKVRSREASVMKPSVRNISAGATIASQLPTVPAVQSPAALALLAETGSGMICGTCAAATVGKMLAGAVPAPDGLSSGDWRWNSKRLEGAARTQRLRPHRVTSVLSQAALR